MNSAGSPSAAASKQTESASPAASEHLTFGEKLGYGLGDTASHFVWDMVGFWLLIFYTDVYKIPPAAAGIIMLIARFWDMGIDPVVGMISDRTQTRWGKFRPYILFGAIPYAVLAILTFTTPHFGEMGKIIYAGATYALLMTAYAAVNLPYSSLAAVMTSDTYERAGVNQYRFICAFIGQLVVGGLALTLAKYFGGGNEAMGYQRTLILFGCLSVVFFFITFAATKERVQPSKSLEGSVGEDLGNLFKNRPWIILALVGIISFVMFAMQNAAIAFYFKYYVHGGGGENSVVVACLQWLRTLLITCLQWFGIHKQWQGNVGDTDVLLQCFNVIGTIALILALPVSKPLAKRFGNRNVFIASSIISGLFFTSLYLPGQKNIDAIFLLNILAKMSYAPAVPLLWTMIADSADYSEWKSGRRATGLCFSAATFAQKAGWGIGAAIAGGLLAAFGYVANAEQTVKALTGIKLLVSVIPGLLYMSCALFMIFYNLDSRTNDLMKMDLDARRKENNPPVERS